VKNNIEAIRIDYLNTNKGLFNNKVQSLEDNKLPTCRSHYLEINQHLPKNKQTLWKGHFFVVAGLNVFQVKIII